MTTLATTAAFHTAQAFSALVAAWNEAHIIERHILSFRDLRWPMCELILCAGGHDGTFARAREAARGATNIHVIEQRAGQGKQASLRTCLEHAAHPFIYLTDADCLFSDEAISALFDALGSGPYEAATGGSYPLPEQWSIPLVQYQHALHRYNYDRNPPLANGIFGRNALLSRRAVDAAGGFGQAVATGTDYHLTKQLAAHGIEIVFAHGSRVPSEYPSTAGQYLRMRRRWLKNLIVHDSHRESGHLALTLGLAIGLLALPLVAIVMPSWWWPLLAFAVAFAAALKSRYQHLRHAAATGYAPDPTTYWLVPVLIYLDQLSVIAAFSDAALPGRRGRW